MPNQLNNFKSIKQDYPYYIFGSDIYTDNIEKILHTLKRTKRYAGRLNRSTVRGLSLGDHVILVASATWAEDVAFLLASGIADQQIVVFFSQVGDPWGFYDFMNDLLDHLDVSEDGQSWCIPFEWIRDKLVKLQSVFFKSADGSIMMDATCFHSNLAHHMGEHMSKLFTVANGFSDEKSRRLYIDLMRWDHVHKIDYFVKEIFNKSQYFEYVNLCNGDVVFNCGVATGPEIPALIGMVGVEGRVHCIDPNGLKYLDDYVKPTVEYFKDSVITHEVALMNYTGKTQFLFSGETGDSSRAVVEGSQNEQPQSGNVVTLPCFTMDDFAEKLGLDRLDLIKMDLEGEEFHLMEGIVSLCNTFRCQVAITIYHKVTHYWDIPLFFMERLDRYSFHLGSYSAGRFEIVLYMIPNRDETVKFLSDTVPDTVLTSRKRDRLGRNCAPMDVNIIQNRWKKLED
ncbi:MAG: FkbM family methyltransferase [Magnetococcales bacterium]|nr:FkbM family methyltransferase [Magnetococcales bacterium]